MTTKTRAAIYARISEDPRQQERGVKRQLDDCEQLAVSRGWSVVARYTDNDLSAFKEGVSRPAYDKMMRDAERSAFDKIICYSTSRVWRRRVERAAAIDKLGTLKIGIVPLTGIELDLSTSQGRSMAAMLGEADTMESDHKRERVARAALDRARDGRANGQVNYGWKREYEHAANGKVIDFKDVEDATEAAVVREIIDRVLTGDTLHKIANDLNDRKVPTPAGAGKWAHTTLTKLCVRPANIGKRVYHGEVIGDAAWPAIIDEDKHARVIALLNRPDRRTSRDGKRTHLLTFGIGQCGICGGRLAAHTIPNSRGERYLIYRCNADVNPNNSCVSRNMALVDITAGRKIIKLLAEVDIATMLAGDDQSAADARDRVKALKAKLDNAADAYVEDRITLEMAERIKAKVEPELQAAQAELEHWSPTAVPPSAYQLAGPSAAEIWGTLDVVGRRAVLKALGISVIINKRAKSGAGFNEDEIIVRMTRNNKDHE